MSFRKRNVGLSSTTRAEGTPLAPQREKAQLPGTRPSPLDGRLTTSTGTATLDGLLAGHSGLALGCSVLIEESGTTDYAGALLRFYAAEGLLQNHHVHVIGLPEQWGRDLPGAVGESEKEKAPEKTEKLKLAWRYESLGQFGTPQSSRERPQASSTTSTTSDPNQGIPTAFCHTFDLTKRLVHPATSELNFVQLGLAPPTTSPFSPVLERLGHLIASSPPSSVHRIVLPSLLSPALYPPHSSTPHYVLPFLHGIRSLMAAFPTRLTAMMSLPLSLYPRSSGLVRWIEHLNDGVFELSPFPHSADTDSDTSRGPPGSTEDQPQGLLQVHKLPILHERGSGISDSGYDWTFALSRRKFTIKPFNLPPVEGDTEAQQADGGDQKEKKPNKATMEF